MNMKLTKQQLRKIIKEELQNLTNEYDEPDAGLSRKTFTYAADRIANALQGAGASGDVEEISNYIGQVLDMAGRSGSPPRMPGQWSDKVGGHEAVAAAIIELFPSGGGRQNYEAINALANEISQGIHSRNED
jgi:hypothetical protein